MAGGLGVAEVAIVEGGGSDSGDEVNSAVFAVKRPLSLTISDHRGFGIVEGVDVPGPLSSVVGMTWVDV
jgi:hypothetical protein